MCNNVLQLAALIWLVIFELQHCSVLLRYSALYVHPDSLTHVTQVNTLMICISSLAAFQSDV